MPLYPAVFQLSALNGTNGFKITGVDIFDGSGISVSAAGDVNGDGFADLIIGAGEADPNGSGSGASYVVFGSTGGFGASFSLAALNGSNGFKVSGEATFDGSGLSVSSAGDVNGDGFDDVIVGARGNGHYDPGASYVVFGKAGGFAANLNLSALNGSNGFKIEGAAFADGSGASVHSAGDFNGDGFDDLIIGAPGYGADEEGAAYVVFGHAGGFSASLGLASLNGTNGFRMSAGLANHETGVSVSSAGDIDGDGFDDVIIGSVRGLRCYVVYGTAQGMPSHLGLNGLVANGDGFRFFGGLAFDRTGRTVSNAGDVNGDGFDDLVVGAPSAGANNSNAGITYVIFGSATRPTADIRVSDIDGTIGFRILGDQPGDGSGYSVSSAGDINGDGYDDMLIGAAGADPNGGDSGANYVIFGKATAFDATIRLSALTGRNGFKIAGEAGGDASGTSVSRAGDVNGDGFDDLIVGAPGAGGFAHNGTSYVIYGFANKALSRIGTAGDDILSGGEFNDTFNGMGGDDWIRSGAGEDNLLGGEGDDMLEGGDGNDSINGEGGNDRLSGGQGNDLMLGGSGNDVFVVSAGSGDQSQGMDGNDTLNFSAFPGGIAIDLSTGTYQIGTDVQFFGSIENVIGGSGADTITGDKFANRLTGGSGNDILVGRGGIDTLIGGTGVDTLTGGGDLDVFVFQTASSSLPGTKRDTITDYTFKEKIDLSVIDANTDVLGNNDFTYIGVVASFSGAGQIRAQQSGADTILFINTNNSQAAEMEIVLTNYLASAITVTDFAL